MPYDFNNIRMKFLKNVFLNFFNITLKWLNNFPKTTSQVSKYNFFKFLISLKHSQNFLETFQLCKIVLQVFTKFVSYFKKI